LGASIRMRTKVEPNHFWARKKPVRGETRPGLQQGRNRGWTGGGERYRVKERAGKKKKKLWGKEWLTIGKQQGLSGILF